MIGGIMKRTIIFCILLLIGGCARYFAEFVRIDRQYQYPAKSANAPIDVYTEDIRQDYEILAVIRSGGNAFTSFQDLVEAMKVKARQVGADAIIVKAQVVFDKTGERLEYYDLSRYGGGKGYRTEEEGWNKPIAACIAIKYKR